MSHTSQPFGGARGRVPLLDDRASRGILVLLVLGMLSFSPNTTADDLDDAFSRLKEGRAYLKDFPKSKTRQELVEDFVGAVGQSPNRPPLAEAIQRAIAIRQGEPPEPEAFPSGQAPRSVQAKVIAWEALEALLTGYLYAGNRDLLNATRITYPGGGLVSDTRELPNEESTRFAGPSQTQLTYARLYFLQGIKDVLEYIAEDTTGALRARGSVFPNMPHYVVFDDERSEVLQPFSRFDDPNFGGPAPPEDREPSQSVAYLHGSAMERLGLAAVSYADQLWRSAYTGPEAGVKRLEQEKNLMLQRATDVLKESIHAEFLASLPLAAQLNDGSGGAVNEYRQSKLDQVRISVTAALRLREQILAGEKPTQVALVSAWDVDAIEQQITQCRIAYEAARLKWEGDSPDGSVNVQINRNEQAQAANFDREVTLRTSIETQLLETTGIPPSAYGRLRTEAERSAYRSAVSNKFSTLFANALGSAQDLNAPGLQDGSLMSVQALRIIQAAREAAVKTALIHSYAERIRVELERNNEVNAAILVGGERIALLDAAIQLANSINVSTSLGLPPSVSVSQNPLIGFSISLGLLRNQLQLEQTVFINAVNSVATVKNLQIEQLVALQELPVVQVNSAIACAEFRRLLNGANSLIDNHIFYQEGTAALWYRDPSLAFRLEKAEDEYQALMQEYRIDLYKLARMLEEAWAERFRNPVPQAASSLSEPLNNRSFDEFTEAESVFGVINHVRGLAYMNALKSWDLKLREPLFRGPYSQTLWDANTFSGQPISLRRDIFKLIDYRYDEVGNRYDVDAALTRQSIQQFRAILLNLAMRDPANANGLTRLRIDFPLTYNQARIILGQKQTVPIVQQNRPAGTFDQFWNHRAKEIGVKIVGKNVFAAGSTVPVSFELFGNVDRIGFFPDSLFTFSRSITSFPVPLYQRDPDKRPVGEPFLGTALGIPAAIGSTQVPMNPVSGWPLFCDNIVVRLGSQGTLRIENIDDIELYIKMEVGSPPPIPAGLW